MRYVNWIDTKELKIAIIPTPEDLEVQEDKEEQVNQENPSPPDERTTEQTEIKPEDEQNQSKRSKLKNNPTQHSNITKRPGTPNEPRKRQTNTNKSQITSMTIEGLQEQNQNQGLRKTKRAPGITILQSSQKLNKNKAQANMNQEQKTRKKESRTGALADLPPREAACREDNKLE